MSLIKDFETSCERLIPTLIPDGEGGSRTTWREGSAFEAAITFNSSLPARKAEHDGVTSLYTVTVKKDIPLRFHDVFRRIADNKVFRVTSDGDDVQTPVRASFAFAQVTAEEWRLT